MSNNNTCIIIEGGVTTTFENLISVCKTYGVNKTMSAVRVAKALDRRNIILICSSFMRDNHKIYDRNGYAVAILQTQIPNNSNNFKITI